MRIASIEFPLHAEKPRFHIYGHFIGDERATPGAKAVVLPEGGDFPQSRLGRLGDVEHVAVPLLKQIQLIHDKRHRVFRKNRRVAVGRGLVACQKALILNVDRHVFQNVPEHQRATHDRRLMPVGAIGLGTENRPLRVNIGLLIQHGFPVCPHALGEISEMCIVFHGIDLLKGMMRLG